MAKQKVTADNLADVIKGILDDYAEDVDRNMREVAHRVAQSGVKALKTDSNEKVNRTGVYAKGWTTVKDSKRATYSETIYNKNKPQITHLLEHGHAKRNGGRVNGIEHIYPVEQEVINAFERQLIEVL